MPIKTKSSIGFRFFTKLFGSALVDAAYQGILGRVADRDGKIIHRRALDEDGDLATLLARLARSEEAAALLPFSSVLESHKLAHQAHFRNLAHTSTTNKKILLMGN
jgi:hypothetical protein